MGHATSQQNKKIKAVLTEFDYFMIQLEKLSGLKILNWGGGS